MSAADVKSAAAAPAAAAKTPQKEKQAKTKKAAVPANHPSYLEMISSAIQALKERSGSSRQAILKYIIANYNVGNDAKAVNMHLKQALKRGVASGALKNAKGGTGASGSFRLSAEKKAVAKKSSPKPAAEKKPKVAATKKPAAKTSKAAAPKKEAGAAKPKKAAAKKGGATGAAAVKAPKTKKAASAAGHSPAKKVPAAKAAPKKAAVKPAAKKTTVAARK